MCFWLMVSLAWAQQVPAEEAEPVDAPAQEPAPAPPAPSSAARPDPTCENLRFGSAREVERVMKAMQKVGHNRFMMVGERMICGWRDR